MALGVPNLQRHKKLYRRSSTAEQSWQRHAVPCDYAHNRGKHRSADDTHDDHRTADLGVRAEPLDTKSENGTEHERHEETGAEHRPQADYAGKAALIATRQI